jgi:hypothetical protein
VLDSERAYPSSDGVDGLMASTVVFSSLLTYRKRIRMAACAHLIGEAWAEG